MEVDNLTDAVLRYFSACEYTEAESVARTILSIDPGNGTALHILGQITAKDGRLGESVEYLGKALRECPNHPDILLHLGSALRLAGNPEQAIPYLRKATDAKRTHPTLLELGLCLSLTNAFEESVIHLSEALELNPDCQISALVLGDNAVKRNQLDEAIRCFRRLVAMAPQNPHWHSKLIRAYLIAGDPASALAACNECLSIAPAYTRAYALKYIAYSELGDHESSRRLFDYAKSIKRIAAKCPAGYTDIREFNAYLANYILSNTETLKGSEKYSTVNGWHSEFGALFKANKALGDAVHGMINGAIEEYISQIPHEPGHPMNICRPQTRQLMSWAVVMDYQGHQNPHIHPKSWLAGAYYVQLPDDFDAQPQKDAGHIAFGLGPKKLHRLREAETVTLKPVEGDFVIFPGYFWHHTIPLLSRQKRICVAFDLQPQVTWGN